MARLAVARLRFCSNSFTPRRTRSEGMLAHEWAAGEAALTRATPINGELDGLRDFLAQRPGWDVTMLRCASAPAGGPLSAGLFGGWMAEIEDSLRRGRFDGVYLSLHGACQAEGDPAADITILRRVRALVGHMPLVASFDMRANLSEEVAILLDGASANQTDRAGNEAGAAARALSMLEGILAGRCRPVGALARVPHVMRDALAPEVLSAIWDSDLLHGLPPVLDASVFSGFAWGDSPYAGPSALVWADRDAGAAREMAAHLAMVLARSANWVGPRLFRPELALRAVPPAAANAQPALLLDPSDDPASGGLADTPDLLRALTTPQAIGQLPGRTIFAALHDPQTVAAALVAGPGKTLPCTLGGHTTKLYGAGVELTCQVRAVGESQDGGVFAVLCAGQVEILLVSTRPATITPALLTQCGIDLFDARLLAIKGGATARAAFDGLVSEILSCDCPGPAHPDLLRLPFHYVPAVRRALPQDLARAAALDVPAPPRPTVAPRPAMPLQIASDDVSADQTNRRYEERRANAQQKRAEAFGA